jgi:hypothetical protein
MSSSRKDLISDRMGSTARELSGVMFPNLQRDYHSNYFPAAHRRP